MTELDKVSLEKAIDTVQERGGICASQQGESIVLVVDDPTYVQGLLYRVDLNKAQAARLMAQLTFLLS